MVKKFKPTSPAMPEKMSMSMYKYSKKTQTKLSGSAEENIYLF